MTIGAAGQRPRVRRGATVGSHHVSSRTEPQAEYMVQPRAGACSCPAGQHHRACWHLALCRALDELDLIGWDTS